MGAPANLKDFLAAQEKKSFLRFLTCGSVDDGKSTLIGTAALRHQTAVRRSTGDAEEGFQAARHTGDDIDFALLVDGLEAERERYHPSGRSHRSFTHPDLLSRTSTSVPLT